MITPPITLEDLLKLWFDEQPTEKSPYTIEGNPPMWATYEDGSYVLFTCPKQTQVRRDSYSPWETVDGCHYMWQHDGKWIGQGYQASLEYFCQNFPPQTPT